MKVTHRWVSSLAFYLLALAATVQFSACEKEEDPCKDSGNRYSSGIFVVNEGAFSTGTGTVSFFDRANDTTFHEIFELENCGEQLGNILQSMTIHDGKAYLVVNNANKIVVVDADNFEKKGEITGLALPRYFLPISNQKALVSQWGADGLTGSVAVINLKNLTVEKTVPTGSGAEFMKQVGDLVYIANSGGLGRDSTVAVFDLGTETVTKKIVVGDNPHSLQVDKNGAIWVIGRGYSDWTDPNLNTPGKLVRIENDAPVFALELAGGGIHLLMEPSTGDRLFYLDGAFGGSIVEFEISQTALSPAALASGFFYSLGYDSVSDWLLAGDAKDFNSSGEVKAFDLQGVEKKTIPAGIIPGGFWAE
ncbi:MAG: DUF5074 domain-containing protein [Bacteroidota bacterium]